jgi:hypothetical protein
MKIMGNDPRVGGFSFKSRFRQIYGKARFRLSLATVGAFDNLISRRDRLMSIIYCG